MFFSILAVGAGGFVGSVLRYLISLIPVSEPFAFPIKTLCINVIGSFVIGLVVAFSKNTSIDETLLLLLKVGICGGFTTFSTFALESFDIFKNGDTFIGISYIVLSVVLSILAVLLGEKLALSL